RGCDASPVESSIESPATPVPAASATLAPTSAGSVAKPPSKSALTGSSTPPAIARKCASASSSDTPLSARPRDQANPELVVASAGKPSCASRRALPRSHGLGITKQPDWWSWRNTRHRSVAWVIAGASVSGADSLSCVGIQRRAQVLHPRINCQCDHCLVRSQTFGDPQRHRYVSSRGGACKDAFMPGEAPGGGHRFLSRYRLDLVSECFGP